MSEGETICWEKRMEQIRITISQLIREYVDLRSSEFLQSNVTSVLLIVFLQTVPHNCKEKSLFGQLQEKVKAKRTQYELALNKHRAKQQALLQQNLPQTLVVPQPRISGSSSGSATSSSSFSIVNNSYSSGSNNNHNTLTQPISAAAAFTPNSGAPSQFILSHSCNIGGDYDYRARRKIEQASRQLAICEPQPLILYPADLIAKVMALIDAKWFIKLSVHDLLNSKMAVDRKQNVKSAHVQKYSTRFNRNIYWLTHTITSHRSIDIRVDQLIQLFDVMTIIDSEYHSYPSLHALHTVISYMKLQLPRTWARFEARMRGQSKWAMFTLEMQRYASTFNDKYYGYKQEAMKLSEARQPFVPCMNPYFQDIYFDENKFAQATKRNSQSSTHSNMTNSTTTSSSTSSRMFVMPRLVHERVSDRLILLLTMQKQCEKHYVMPDSADFKDIKNHKNDESQLFALFKKKSIKDIDEILVANKLQFKDLQLFFVERCSTVDAS